MIRSLAVLSDVHGVDPALRAVLDEPDVRAADLVVVTGDHASGPQPTEVLERLVALGERCLLVRGNADRELVALARGEMVPGDLPDVDHWAAAQLGAHHVDLLAALPHPITLEVEGVGPVLCCHGSPRDDDEVLLVQSPVGTWADALAGVPDEVWTVTCGHTHMPFVRRVDRRTVLNPGSVGMPYGSPLASWALVTADGVQLRHADVDPDAVADEVVARSTFPGREEWAETYLRRPPSDREAVEAFEPRVAR
ncbi:metallophosphoesterase family protein [Solicola sp. PLA-1-18]|uniref:metallophosphoesterase family protein n=1 Tax=Solicola sp. PLA-1-18 TaxID=3380532 RepID=UPI003B77E156